MFNYSIKSEFHEIELTSQKKIALTGFSDKRVIEDNGVRTWPHGNCFKCEKCYLWHFRLKKINKLPIVCSLWPDNFIFKLVNTLKKYNKNGG